MTFGEWRENGRSTQLTGEPKLSFAAWPMPSAPCGNWREAMQTFPLPIPRQVLGMCFTTAALGGIMKGGNRNRRIQRRSRVG